MLRGHVMAYPNLHPASIRILRSHQEYGSLPVFPVRKPCLNILDVLVIIWHCIMKLRNQWTLAICEDGHRGLSNHSQTLKAQKLKKGKEQ